MIQNSYYELSSVIEGKKIEEQNAFLRQLSAALNNTCL